MIFKKHCLKSEKKEKEGNVHCEAHHTVWIRKMSNEQFGGS